MEDQITELLGQLNVPINLGASALVGVGVGILRKLGLAANPEEEQRKRERKRALTLLAALGLGVGAVWFLGTDELAVREMLKAGIATGLAGRGLEKGAQAIPLPRRHR
jgi:hypothetical protein